MKGQKTIFSHKSDDWQTPKYIYDHFIEHKYIDPCPLNCIENNLIKDFGNNDLYINPPYSNIKDWIEFSLKHINKYKTKKIALLIPSRTDTKYFQKMLNSNCKTGIYFFKGRLHFNETKESAPFPSCLIILEYSKENINYIINDYKFNEERTIFNYLEV